MIYLGSEQPETCRTCGVRTEFVEQDSVQLHTCKNCDISYVVEFENFLEENI